MQKIFKYAIPYKDYFSLNLPKGAKILSVQNQRGEAQMWAMVNPKNPPEKRNFLFAETGKPIKEKPEQLNHLGTFQGDAGAYAYIGHVFEII